MRKPVTTSGAARILKEADGTVRSKARRGLYTFTVTESGVRLFDPEDLERIVRERAEPRLVVPPSSDKAL